MSEPTPEKVHRANPGVRVARVCTECNTRKFDAPDWKCSCAGGRKTVSQPNMPYFGQSTE